MPKQVVKIADLAQLGSLVDISDEQQIRVRPLTLREMVTLFIESREAFLPLYGAGLDGANAENLVPFLMASPDLVAKVIALASDEPDSAPMIEKHMPATVQLIALSEIWKVSVPDPKKARELLSEVTALLRKLEAKAVSQEIPLPSSQTISPPL